MIREPPDVMATQVERLFPGETIAILGCGPSLNADDVNYLRGKVRVIAINAAHKLAPWADVMYAADAKYWAHVKGAPNFTGPKYSIDANSGKWHSVGVKVLKIAGSQGLSLDPTMLAMGANSGYQSVNLAVHLGAKRILLLGYDMQKVFGREHFTNDYPAPTSSPYQVFLRHFASIVEPLKKVGVSVINCTPRSALTVFPRMPLREALPDTDEHLWEWTDYGQELKEC